MPHQQQSASSSAIPNPYRPSAEPLIFLGMACMKVGLSTIYQINYDYFAEINGFNVENKTDSYGCQNQEMTQAQKDTQTDTNEWGKYTQLVYTVSALSAFILSAMSDRYGRRNVLLVCLLGQLAFYVIHLLQLSFNLSIYLQLLANFINGITGGAYILLSVSYASIADVTKHDKSLRATRISIAELCIGLGSATVAFINGYILKYTENLKYSLIFINILQTVAVLYCLFYLDDNYQIINNSVYKGLIKKYKYSFYTYTKYRPNNGTLILWLLVLTYIFNVSRDVGQGAVLTLYEKNFPFCWSRDQVSFAQSLQELTFVVGILLSIFISKMGLFGKLEDLSNERIIIIGIAFNILSSVLLGLSGVSFYDNETTKATNTVNSILLLAGLVSPAILAPAITPLLRTKWVEFCKEDEHGAIFGLPAVLSTLAIGVTTFIYQSLYSYIFGLVFIVVSVSLDCFSLVSFVGALIGMRRGRRRKADGELKVSVKR